MRKLFILPIIVSVFFADFGAFGAAARGGRGNSSAGANNASSGVAPVAARAAVRGGAKPASTSAAQPAKQGAPVAARAAARNTPKTAAKASAGAPVAARAGAKQKVINMGTKISSAATNTTVDQECQNAFFGCMDSFCMLDNVSGGRCHCSDKNAEYESLLSQIMEMDEQSQVLQTEGVSLLKMGKSADEVYAMAEKAAKKVSGDKKDTNKQQDTKKGSKVDLTAWNNSLFADVEEELEAEEDVNLGIDIKNKTGDDLQNAVAKTCARQVPDKCKDSVSLLRPMYSQKITSDCAAFGNSLKQQQMESNQKLFAAKQALRDTALEKYNEANRYDLGGCVREYTSCMQKEDVCGDGFLGCVTFAAVDNMKSGNKSGGVAKQTTIKGTYSSFTLAASTVEQLMSKRVMCDSILEQCVNVQSRVWDAFLKNVAPTLKVAESNAESDLRMNCVETVSQCFQKACKEQMDPNDKDGSYDICLSNPELYKSLCKVQLEPCLLATNGDYDHPENSSLWNSLKARLESMKVDACTQEVKDCLLSDDRCGKDYAGCIGLSTYQIGLLCPYQKLTACMDQSKDDPNPEQTVRDYVARIAEGLALNIDNSMLTQCQTALKQAMVKYCGDEESCPMARVDESLFKGILHVDLCNPKKTSGDKCSSDPYYFEQEELLKGQVQAMLVGKVDITALSYNNDMTQTERFSIEGDRKDSSEFGYDKTALDRAKQSLTGAFNNLVNAIQSDPKVQYCIEGRNFSGFESKQKSDPAFASFIERINGGGRQSTRAGSSNKEARFPNLTDTIKNSIGQQLIDSMYSVYQSTQIGTFDEQFAAMSQKLNDRISDVVQLGIDQLRVQNSNACSEMQDIHGRPSVHGCRENDHETHAEYDPEKNICTVKKIHYHRGGCGAAYDWKIVEEDTEINTIAMPSLSKEAARNQVLNPAEEQ